MTPIVKLPVGLGRLVLEKLVVRGMPDLRARDVTTQPVAVPAGARLRFAVGVEEAAWHVDSAPIEMTVTALLDGGGAREIYRRRLDPHRVEADRNWFDADVPLDELAGMTVRFRFASRPVLRDDPRSSLPLWGDPTVWAPRRDDARPSVVLVSLDTLRARSMSLDGYELETTPYLTELARSATTFERTFTTYVNTIGSHMSLPTGLYPAQHGVLFLTLRLPPERRTLAETLRGAGWDTAAVTENGYLTGELGFRRGFSTWFENRVHKAAGNAPETFRRALAWARSRESTPFFLFVHTYAVHKPYKPAAAYRRFFENGRPARTRPFHERLQLRYEQEIRELDDQLRAFVEELEKIVPADRLLLIITADHGEEFREHEQFTHVQLYDEVMHVPLLVRWDGVVRPGARSNALVSLVDVAPTVLDLLGLPPLPDADGTSLAAIARGEADSIPRKVVFAQSIPYGLTGVKWHFIGRTAETKCILAEDDTVECFDLTDDPREQRPRVPGESPRLGEVHELVRAYRERAMRPIIAAGKQTVEDGFRQVDAETERNLRALGYAQ